MPEYELSPVRLHCPASKVVSSTIQGGPVLRATRRDLLLLGLIVLLSLPSFALHTRARYRRRAVRVRHTRHIVWRPLLLRGSHDSLVRQNEEIDRLQLPRIADDAELEELIQEKQLVPLPVNAGVRVDPRLEAAHRYCRPWTRQFLEDLGDAYYKEFRQPIQVNSAVRTVEQQKKLRRHNRNAAPITGDTASSHLAGLTVDIAKHGMSGKQRRWMEQYLVKMRTLGLVEVAEERRQAVFHVMVSDRYTAWRDAELVVNR